MYLGKDHVGINQVKNFLENVFSNVQKCFEVVSDKKRKMAIEMSHILNGTSDHNIPILKLIFVKVSDASVMNFSSSVNGATRGGCLFVDLCFFLCGATMKLLSEKDLKSERQG